MAEMLADLGYGTAMFGKWHLGRTEGRFPTDQGFDEWYGIPNTTDESTWSEALTGFKETGMSGGFVMEGRKGEIPNTVRPYDLDYRPLIDGDLTAKAIDFMKRQVQENRPFFLYLPYTATHYPTLPHPDFAGKTRNGRWADILHQIDQYVGMLLDEVDKLGIRDNTIFIFTADNGPEALPAGGTNLTVETVYPGTAGPWRGTLGPLSHFRQNRRWKGPYGSSDRRCRPDGFPPRPAGEVQPRGGYRVYGREDFRGEVARLETAL
jgi:arylsulfatase